MELDARMDDLECRQAFQDDTLQALNDVVVEQQRSIERLQLQVAALIKRLEDVQGLVGKAGEDEAPPPHY
ncbi:TPA: SlyX family protein [Pseudomonas aeruginosa]|nr:SlyX family protein [Pseudomonas aeruginosa]